MLHIAQCRIFAWHVNKGGAVPAKIRNADDGFAGEHKHWQRVDCSRLSKAGELYVERSEGGYAEAVMMG